MPGSSHGRPRGDGLIDQIPSCVDLVVAHGHSRHHDVGGDRVRISQDGPKNINMPGFREVVRCSQCGNVVQEEITAETRCPRCGTDLRSCAQCQSFDPGSRFECMQATLTARVSPKNARNACTFYSPRTTVERETTTPKVDSARKAFDDLFKF